MNKIAEICESMLSSTISTMEEVDISSIHVTIIYLFDIKIAEDSGLLLKPTDLTMEKV